MYSDAPFAGSRSVGGIVTFAGTRSIGGIVTFAGFRAHPIYWEGAFEAGHSRFSSIVPTVYENEPLLA